VPSRTSLPALARSTKRKHIRPRPRRPARADRRSTSCGVAQQGMITEEGYKAQQQAYTAMASAADMTATGSFIGAAIKGVAAIASVFLPAA
jgi:hypothetical protein